VRPQAGRTVAGAPVGKGGRVKIVACQSEALYSSHARLKMRDSSGV
jgi:hypothetical protein